MSAGVPNWQKLYEMGKLPKEARGKISSLVQLDAAEKRIKELEVEVSRLRIGWQPPEDDISQAPQDDVEIKCEVGGCDYIAKGKSEAIAKNNLRLHSRSHGSKE